MIDLWLPPKPAIIRPHIEKASCLPGMFPAGMAAAAKVATFPIVQATNIGSTSAATSYAVPLPASISSGDLLLLFVGVNNTRTLTTPSGWTQVENTISGAIRLAVYFKVATGSEGSTVSVSSSGSCNFATNAYRITGYQGSPEAGSGATGSSTAPNSPSLSPTWGSAKTLWIAAASNGNVGSFTATPTGYGNQLLASGASIPKTISLRREIEAASEDPSAFTVNSSSAWVAHTVAIRPA